MKIFALIFFLTTVIRGVIYFAKEETYQSFPKFAGALIYTASAIASYHWLLTQFLTFK